MAFRPVNDKIISIKLNQDRSCFTCCRENGSDIYNVEPLVQKWNYDAEKFGTLICCEMINRTNLIVMVGGGSRAKYADNTVLVYDDDKKRFIIEFTFIDAVISVKCQPNLLAAVLTNQIHVYSIPNNPQKLISINTRPNPLGLCEITPAASGFLAFPGNHTIGTLQIMNTKNLGNSTTGCMTTIAAHAGELACLAVNQKGSLIGTASKQGTRIRVWNVMNKDRAGAVCVGDFRRGQESANIYSINFSAGSEFMCCSSEKGTVHIFALKNPQLNRRSILSNIGIINSLAAYSGFQWSMASFAVPQGSQCTCAFSTKDTIVAICQDGTFYKYGFGSGGICNLISHDSLYNIAGEEKF